MNKLEKIEEKIWKGTSNSETTPKVKVD